jgi:uncharacterized protein YndB with AHSA1/START domain
VGYESFSVSEVIPAEPERIYAAWMSSDEHTAFTGDRAEIEPFVGGKHSAFAGYAVGTTVELLPGRRIAQTWRATDFPPGSPDSRVEVTLETTVGGTMVTILHTEIPSGRSDVYRDSWMKYYLEPLREYFAKVPKVKGNGVPTVAPVRVKAKAKKAKAKVRPVKKAKAKAKKPVRAAKPKAKARRPKKKPARPKAKPARSKAKRAGKKKPARKR